MSRMPRRGRVSLVPRHNDSLNRFKQAGKIKGSNGMQVSRSPLLKLRSKERCFVNRCCYVSPVKRDFGQYYTGLSPSTSKDKGQVTQRTDHEQLPSIIQDQYGNDPVIPNITSLKESKKVPCDTRNKVKIGSQHTGQSSGNSKFAAASDKSHWQKVDNAEEVDNFLTSSESSGIGFPSKHMFISNVPNVKIIAEKFSKYKRGTLELRRLDEKVVCVQYDIFNQPANDAVLKPVQRMRAFFSIKPFDNDSGHKQGLSTLPSKIKNEFKMLDEDHQKLTEKEIEFIDSKIEENKSYLEDLRRILKRKHVINAQKNKTSLDLQSLYKMAKEDRRPLNCDFSETNLLSKAELQEIKDLILQQCTSSVHGFSRRTIKRKENGSAMDPSGIFEIIMAELSR